MYRELLNVHLDKLLLNYGIKMFERYAFFLSFLQPLSLLPLNFIQYSYTSTSILTRGGYSTESNTQSGKVREVPLEPTCPRKKALYRLPSHVGLRLDNRVFTRLALDNHKAKWGNGLKVATSAHALIR